MKLPKTFVPEKNLENNVKDLLSEKTEEPKQYSKVRIDHVTLNQLAGLVYLEEKIDHVKIGFEYMGVKHQLVYTANPSKGKGLFQLLQVSKEMSSGLIKRLADNLKNVFNTHMAYELIYYTMPNCYWVADFPTALEYDLAGKLKQFFKYKARNKKKGFANIKAFVEYNDLTREDMKHLSSIPKIDWIE